MKLLLCGILLMSAVAHAQLDDGSEMGGMVGGEGFEAAFGQATSGSQMSAGATSGSGNGQQSSGASSGSGSGQQSSGSSSGSGNGAPGQMSAGFVPEAVADVVPAPGSTGGSAGSSHVTCSRDQNNKLVCRNESGADVSARESVDDPSKIRKGQVCHAECKPTGGFLGIGAKSGFDRPTCEPCMKQHPDVYAFIETGDGDILMSQNDFCYDKCKPSRGIQGLIGRGKEKQFAERRSCLDCMQKNPRYRTMLNPSFQKGAMGQANCTLSEDREYAYCNGDLYKKDSSVDASDRSVPRGENSSDVVEPAAPAAGASSR